MPILLSSADYSNIFLNKLLFGYLLASLRWEIRSDMIITMTDILDVDLKIATFYPHCQQISHTLVLLHQILYSGSFGKY